VRALRAFVHVNPRSSSASDEDQELAQAGALLVNEWISNSRALVERPMQIRFLTKLASPEVKLEDLGGDEPA
jgi:hypothetical protein